MKQNTNTRMSTYIVNTRRETFEQNTNTLMSTYMVNTRAMKRNLEQNTNTHEHFNGKHKSHEEKTLNTAATHMRCTFIVNTLAKKRSPLHNLRKTNLSTEHRKHEPRSRYF